MKNYMIVERPVAQERVVISTSFKTHTKIVVENRNNLTKLRQLIKDEFPFRTVFDPFYLRLEVHGNIPIDRLAILTTRAGLSKAKITYTSPTIYDVYEFDGEKL